jgi:hypothetical protein
MKFKHIAPKNKQRRLINLAKPLLLVGVMILYSTPVLLNHHRELGKICIDGAEDGAKGTIMEK